MFDRYFFIQQSCSFVLFLFLVQMFCCAYVQSESSSSQATTCSLKQHKKAFAVSVFGDIKNFCEILQNSLGSALAVIKRDQKTFNDVVKMVECWEHREELIFNQLLAKINFLKLRILELKENCQNHSGSVHIPAGGGHGVLDLTPDALFDYISNLEVQIINQQQQLSNQEQLMVNQQQQLSHLGQELEDEHEHVTNLEQEFACQQQDFYHVLADLQSKLDAQIVTLQQNNQMAKESFKQMYSLLMNTIDSSVEFIEEVGYVADCLEPI